MKNFDWEEFRTEYRVVHCDTEEKANDFLKQAHKHGMKWTGGQSLLEVNYYNNDKEDTCYGTQICINTLMYHSTISSCYRDSNIIIDWEID